ncbi:MAG TPA: hypothetical protein ENJ35_05045 [Gammaproteobacteria bacterium]|nr:hypothetical protein [Gammaproteobacteria bacterium]
MFQARVNSSNFQTGDIYTVSRTARIVRALTVSLLMFCCLLIPGLSLAAKSSIAIVLSSDTAEYQTIAERIRQGLRDSRHYDRTVHLLIADQISGSQKNSFPVDNPGVVVTIGVKALRVVLDKKDTDTIPVYAVFVPRLSYEKLLRESRQGIDRDPSRRLSALFLDQPVGRQLRLAKWLSPEFSRAGVLLGTTTRILDKALARAASRLDLELVEIRAENSRKIIPALNRAKNKIDFLLTIFDPDIISRNSAKQILYLSYNHHLPVIGYSRAMVKAGALAAVYSNTDQIGRQAAEELITALDSDPVRLPRPRYPDYYQAICNQSVVRYFHIKLECDLTAFPHAGAAP